MHSPLGQYAEIVAAVVAIITVMAAIVSRPLGFQDPFLDTIAGLSLGAIFGSTATANGVKTGQATIIDKLDSAAAIAVHDAQITADRANHSDSLRRNG